MVATIHALAPRLAILENVRGLTHKDYEKDWETIRSALQQVADDVGYVFLYSMMDAREHGLPMRRNRMWMLLLKREHHNGSFQWPGRLLPVLPEPLLDGQPLPLAQLTGMRPEQRSYHKSLDGVLEKLRREGGISPLERTVFVELGARGQSYGEVCPNLAHEVKPFWLTNRGRTLNTDERMRLMGHDPNLLKLAVGTRQFEKQLGNSMPLNVLERLLCRALPSVGLTGSLLDRWNDGSRYTELAATAQRQAVVF